MVSWNTCEACKFNVLMKVDMGACQQSIYRESGTSQSGKIENESLESVSLPFLS